MKASPPEELFLWHYVKSFLLETCFCNFVRKKNGEQLLRIGMKIKM